MTNNKELISVINLFEKDYEGKEFNVVTDNNYYGMTLKIKDGQLINKRSGEPLSVSHELLFKTRVKLQETQKKVSLHDFLEAYKAGKKVKVVYQGSEHPFNTNQFEKSEAFLPNLLSSIGLIEAITMDELLYGDFYIIE